MTDTCPHCNAAEVLWQAVLCGDGSIDDAGMTTARVCSQDCAERAAELHGGAVVQLLSLPRPKRPLLKVKI